MRVVDYIGILEGNQNIDNIDLDDIIPISDDFLSNYKDVINTVYDPFEKFEYSLQD